MSEAPGNIPRMDAALADYLLHTSQSVPAILFSDAGDVVRHNAAAANLLGKDQLKQGFAGIFLDFHQRANLLEWAQEISTLRLSVVTAHGLPETMQFSFRRMAPPYILAIGEMDSEETKSLRANLLATNQELGNISRELHRKNAQLNRLATLKNEFLGIAAHDLRNPIGSIRQLCDLLLFDEATLPPASTELIRLIRDVSGSMITLLDDLLDISAIEAGSFKLRLSDEDARDLIDRAILLGGCHAQKKRTRILWTRPQNPLMLRVDAHKFVQAASNLISNAIKYSPTGSEVKIEVRYDETRFRFMVVDRGPGIPVEEQKRLFESFSTGSASSQTEEKATGLGLLIVKKIVTAHGGTAGVIDAPDGGCCFWFELPLRTARAVEPGGAAP